jgi:hypothetical protein
LMLGRNISSGTSTAQLVHPEPGKSLTVNIATP